MNLTKAFLLFLFSLGLPLLLSTCSNEPLVNPREELPPHTCEAKGTFGCLLDDELFVTKSISVQYDFRNNPYEGTFRLQALRNNETEGIRVYLYNQVMDTGYYALGSTNSSKREIRYSSIKDQVKLYYCEPGMFGELHVTGIDTVNRILCGTFSFDAVNENNNLDTVNIRDARFDATFYY